MDGEKYTRSVMLICPTCGNTQLESLAGEQVETIRCPSCNRTMTRDELIRENGENIEANIEEMKEEIFEDVKNELNRIFRR